MNDVNNLDEKLAEFTCLIVLRVRWKDGRKIRRGRGGRQNQDESIRTSLIIFFFLLNVKARRPTRLFD